ncbi:dihydroorotate oxidase [Apilactobacillus timberlakei]|uniref:dihydroorotate oxidase n=1 Tax=Apilactobacillus timberlakei TaxID=2008380 RepID=UPI001129173D|nr:dihydroorotate oxidase [Apilactobacillus timberlakei]TPR18911.1 dihydroorotate oxidase [Apilactobacillus timberlakei]TPR20925.1 dihydroorotate oxidase [Apilactobacillus timberlakei]TPR23576.1 dihydroorotate oxidase [Apilactobacillus timberlakei]
MTVDLSSKIQNTQFKNLFLNASGIHCQSKKELEELMNDHYSGGLVTKSATPNSRFGNPLPRYHSLPAGSINSMGLPNEGFQFYLDYVTHSNIQKPTILSIAGMSKEEDLELLHQIQDSKYQGLTELNLSCPNVIGKPQMAYDFASSNQMLKEIFAFFKKPLGIKLPPYFDLVHFDKIAKILNQYPLSHVNTINSIGNGMWVDIESESTVLKPKGGFGGVGGAIALPTALANVRALRERLNSSINIIGTGGVTTGQDAFAHILCGADMVSIGTQLYEEGLGAFQRINNELIEIMKAKGYHSLDDFRGKLKEQ